MARQLDSLGLPHWRAFVTDSTTTSAKQAHEPNAHSRRRRPARRRACVKQRLDLGRVPSIRGVPQCLSQLIRTHTVTGRVMIHAGCRECACLERKMGQQVVTHWNEK